MRKHRLLLPQKSRARDGSLTALVGRRRGRLRKWRMGGTRPTRGPRLVFTSARVSRAWCRGWLRPAVAASTALYFISLLHPNSVPSGGVLLVEETTSMIGPRRPSANLIGQPQTSASSLEGGDEGRPPATAQDQVRPLGASPGCRRSVGVSPRLHCPDGPLPGKWVQTPAPDPESRECCSQG